MKDILQLKNPRFSVIGGGSWATALVKLLTGNNLNVSWYIRDINVINYINENGRHKSYLQAVELNTAKIDMSDDICKVVEQGDILILATPSAYFLNEIKKCTVSAFENKFIISAIKGFVSEHNLTIAEFFNRIYKIPYDMIGVLSGPCHAEEVSMGKLSYMTVSTKHRDVAEYVCAFFKNKYVKTIAGTDIYGVEYSAALKNIYALGTGICRGLGYGDNFTAVLISNAFNELKCFLNATHPDKDRITSKSAYIGDLLVTCYSQFSRNRRFGRMIGKGHSVASAQLEMKQIAEGYYASKAIYEINKKYKIDMPIADAVHSILYENKSTAKIIKQLIDVLQ